MILVRGGWVLRLRLNSLSRESEELLIGEVKPEDSICQSKQVLGNGSFNEIYDVVMVDFENFDRGKSKAVAIEVSKINAKLIAERRPYILFGVGRWGSMDPWLGIPVTWDQISGASVIVEAGFKDFSVAPSQGSHFFQNLTSFRVGYFTVNSIDKSDFIDWDWLYKQTVHEELLFIKHLRFDKPISVRMNGHETRGVIFKPGFDIEDNY